MTGSWLDLELGLGRVLAEKVKKWAWSKPPAEGRDELKAWREGFLVDLTEGAFHIAVMNGVKGFPLEVELRLYRAFRSVVKTAPRRRLRNGEAFMKHYVSVRLGSVLVLGFCLGLMGCARPASEAPPAATGHGHGQFIRSKRICHGTTRILLPESPRWIPSK